MIALRIATLATLLAGVACLPNPQSVKERRESFDRSELRESRLLLDAAPTDMVRVDAEFGRKIKLLGYTLDPSDPKPGQRIQVTFYWSAMVPLAEDYKIFVHGDALGGNAARIHGDHFPAEGQYPTDVWREGEVVVDPFKVTIPRGYAPDALGLFTGLYLDGSNFRMPLTQRGSAEADNENRSRAVTLRFR